MSPSTPDLNASARWSLFAVVLIVCAVAWLDGRGTLPPEPRSADSPADEFSAIRATEALERVLGRPARPHPVGSVEHEAVRGRLVQELRSTGIEPEVQSAIGLYSNNYGAALVHNIIARLEGREPGRTVLLVAHYDSVTMSPGVGDDGSGIATLLEVARALGEGPQPRHTVMFLMTDGEELGLCGAEAFAELHPDFADVAVVMNFELRGSSGASRMFETNVNNGRWIEAFDRAVEHPVASSLYSEIYRRMPNGSDLTVFLERDVAGFNFAAIDGWNHYHTPTDNFDSLSPASIQHHGDQALALTRHLANIDLPDVPPSADPAGDAVYTDLFGHIFVRWPARWSPALAFVGLILIALVIRREGPGQPGLRSVKLWLGLGALALAPIASVLLATRLIALAHDGRAIRELAQLPTRVALLSTAAFATCLVVSALARRCGPRALWGAFWLAVSVAGCAIAIELPGASYLLLLPTLAAGWAGLMAGFAGRPTPALARHVALCLSTAVVAVLWVPLSNGFELALGLGQPAPQALAVVFIAAASGPLWADLRHRAALASLALLGVVSAGSLAWAMGASPDPAWVAPVNISTRLSLPSGERRAELHVLGRAPDSLLTLGDFTRIREGDGVRTPSEYVAQLPGLPGHPKGANIEVQPCEAPAAPLGIDIVDRPHIQLTITPPPEARAFRISFAGAEIRSLRAQGHERDCANSSGMTLTGFGRGPVEIVASISDPESLRALITTLSDVPPDDVLPWVELRDRETHSVHWGDVFATETLWVPEPSD